MEFLFFFAESAFVFLFLMTGRREGAAGAVTGFQPGGVARFLGTKNSGNRNKKIETQKLRAKRVFIAGEAISPPPPPP